MRSARPVPPSLEVTTVAYHMSASHDLLQLHRLFALTTARDSSRGHLPGISDFLLAVGSPEQSTMAKFGALGFEAAAVTAFGAVALKAVGHEAASPVGKEQGRRHRSRCAPPLRVGQVT